MLKIKRHLDGFGPKPSERLNVHLPIFEYLWPVALALSGARPTDDDPDMIGGEWEIEESNARALAAAMGCVLPSDHDWFVGTSAG